jgi:hypothetical protein
VLAIRLTNSRFDLAVCVVAGLLAVAPMGLHTHVDSELAHSNSAGCHPATHLDESGHPGECGHTEHEHSPSGGHVDYASFAGLKVLLAKPLLYRTTMPVGEFGHDLFTLLPSHEHGASRRIAGDAQSRSVVLLI